MDENLENKPKGFQRTKTLKILEIIILVLLVCLLGSIIYDQFIAKGNNEPKPTTSEKAGLSDEDKLAMLNLLGITEEGYKKEVHYDIPANADMNPYEIQSIMLSIKKTGDIKLDDLSNDDIIRLIYSYALNNNMIVNKDAEVGVCNGQSDADGNGYCATITPETYKEIAALYGITKAGATVFANQLYQNNYYFTAEGYFLTPVTITDKVTFEEDNDLVKLIYDIKVEDTDNAVTDNKTFTYTFKKSDGKYVIAGINIKDNLAVYNGEVPTESSETN